MESVVPVLVLSNLKRIAELIEKRVDSSDDFQYLLKHAQQFINIQSELLQEPDLNNKSHLVCTINLSKRHRAQEAEKVAVLNIVKLCGSEQAMSTSNKKKEDEIRNFIRKSFNGLSSMIVKSTGQSSKYKSSKPPATRLEEILRESVNKLSDTILVCCVSPSQKDYKHSLPAIKVIEYA